MNSFDTVLNFCSEFRLYCAGSANKSCVELIWVGRKLLALTCLLLLFSKRKHELLISIIHLSENLLNIPSHPQNIIIKTSGHCS